MALWDFKRPVDKTKPSENFPQYSEVQAQKRLCRHLVVNLAVNLFVVISII